MNAPVRPSLDLPPRLFTTQDVFRMVEAGIMAEMLFVEPDLMLYPRRLKPQEITGPDITLLVEVSDDSISRDLGLKAAIYSQYGVADYWVVDVETRRVIVHRRPSDEGYRSVEVFDADAEVAALRAQELKMRLGDLVAA